MLACLVFGAACMGGAVASAQPEINIGMTKLPPPDYSDREVTFETADGVKIVADFYPIKVKPREKTPVAILIHMYPKDRKSWAPLVPDLREKGIAVLAYDIRGNGGSIAPESMNLKQGYQDRSPDHFRHAAMDTLGAISFLGTQEFIDTERIMLIGASIGCSISLDTATRTNDIKGIVCLSPGVDYFEVDSIAHIRYCSAYTPILLMAPEAEYEAVQKLIEASGDKARGEKFEGGREYHGTNLFDAPYGKTVRKKIVKFTMECLGIKDKKPATAANSDGKKRGGKKKRRQRRRR